MGSLEFVPVSKYLSHKEVELLNISCTQFEKVN